MKKTLVQLEKAYKALSAAETELKAKHEFRPVRYKVLYLQRMIYGIKKKLTTWK